MLDKIGSVLIGKCGLVKGKPVLVGVSGGADSLCLMHILHEAGYSIVVGHFNHKLRPESDAEAREVGHEAGRLKVPFVSENGAVSTYAESKGISIEEAARTLRYQFLFAQAHRFDVQAVAVGHTADDQVETVLMHLLRGTGLAGLKGIQYRTILRTFDDTIPLVRPLLDVWREETLSFCETNNLHPHYDSSNESLDFLRNNVRHKLIPTLETYNPRIKEAIWRMTKSLTLDYDFLQGMVDAKRRECIVKETGEFIQFNLASLSKYPLSLQRRIIDDAFKRFLPGGEIDYLALERASTFLTDPAQTRIDLTSGLTFFREGDSLFIARREADLPFDLWPQIPPKVDSVAITLPGQTVLSSGWKFHAQWCESAASASNQSRNNKDRFQVWMDAESMPEKLELRIPRAGDVFEPLGMRGHSQKLSDFFTNVKLPRRARERWPLLCIHDKVIWIPGYRPAESFKLKKTSRKVAYFCLTAPQETLEEK